ncbi:hypothetical protein KQI82_03025 [Oscillibacter sp. MSJ-2]|uniref:Uncharacterized protein n=1 Tax=Dysosmobacter acutus TaxID=2841504 RepID=A0ABS6F790_9FIRM|nr:hypothetical protein [Dysosmobacter acutus]MBU5625910.1 hypothetical protein [Dysosmobacter acutus]
MALFQENICRMGSYRRQVRSFFAGRSFYAYFYFRGTKDGRLTDAQTL